MRIFGYLFAIFTAVIFALYLSASTGWMFVFIMSIAPIFSIIITAVTKKTSCISITAETDSTMIYKKDTLTLKVCVKNKSILPIPALFINLYLPPELENLNANNGIYSVSISPRSETVFEVKYKAKYWGSGLVGIKNIRLHDFMRFVSFKLYNEKELQEFRTIIKVFPNIPDVSTDSLLIRTVSEDIQFYDDSEESKESDGLSLFNGIPGYTHREYVLGDPIKRINWKLSAKRDNLFIRLDDEVEAMQQTIILDSVALNNAYDNEKAVEGVLAMCYSLVRLGFEADVFYKVRGVFVSFSVESAADVISLQTAFADYTFTSPDIKSIRLPDDLFSSSKHSNVLIYSPLTDKGLLSAIHALEAHGTNTTIVSSDDNKAILTENTWRLNDDYSAEKVL